LIEAASRSSTPCAELGRQREVRIQRRLKGGRVVDMFVLDRTPTKEARLTSRYVFHEAVHLANGS
jgi:hypothetical protein